MTRLIASNIVAIGLLLGSSTAALAQAQDRSPSDADSAADVSGSDEDAIIVEGQRVIRDEEATALAADFVEYGTQVQLISDAEIKTGGFTNFGELAAGLIRGANVGYSPDEGEFTIRIDGGTD